MSLVNCYFNVNHSKNDFICFQDLYNTMLYIYGNGQFFCMEDNPFLEVAWKISLNLFQVSYQEES